MPNIAVVLKDEIARLARREIRRQTDVLRKASAQYRKDIAELKRRVNTLQRKIVPLEKQTLRGVSAQVPDADAGRTRFTAKGLRSQRKRLGLSADDCGKIIGVTGQTIYNWERNEARPRREQIAKIASLRRMGKKEVLARLAQLKSSGKKKSK